MAGLVTGAAALCGGLGLAIASPLPGVVAAVLAIGAAWWSVSRRAESPSRSDVADDRVSADAIDRAEAARTRAEGLVAGLERERDGAVERLAALNERVEASRASAQEEAQRARAESERAHRWLDAVPGVVVRIDADGRIAWMSPGAEAVLGDAVGQPLSERLGDWRPGRSGEHVLDGDAKRTVRVATGPETGDGWLVALHDQSASLALEAARDAAAGARARFAALTEAIVPETDPSRVVAGLAPRLGSLLGASHVALELRSAAPDGTARTWQGGVDGALVAGTCSVEASAFRDVHERGEERVALDGSAAWQGVGAYAAFPLDGAHRSSGVFAVGFRDASVMSAAVVATVRGVVDRLASAVRAALAFERADAQSRAWRDTLDALPDPVLLVGAGRVVEFANRRARTWFDDHPVDGRPLDELIGRDGDSAFVAERRAAPAGGPPRTFKVAGRDAEMTVSHVARDDGGVAIVALRDVSQLRAEAEAGHRREEEVEGLYQLALDLGRSLDLPWVMEQVFAKALDVTQLDCGWVTLIEHETDARDLAASHRVEIETVRSFYDPHGHVGFEDRVLRTKKPVVLESLSEDPTIDATAAARSGLRSLVSVPLVLNQEVVGILNLASRGTYQFRIQDIENLGNFGRIFARGVANSKRFYEMRRRAEKARELIADQLERIRALSDQVGDTSARVETYRELLVALWGAGGALATVAEHVSPPDAADADRSAWQLPFAIGRVLPRYLDERATHPAAFDLVAVARDAGFRDGDRLSIDGDRVGIHGDFRDALLCVRAAVDGLRPIGEHGFDATIASREQDAALVLAFDATEQFGSAADLTRAMRSLEDMPRGRAYLVLVLLHLLDRVLSRSGGGVEITRGEGRRLEIALAFSGGKENGPDA